ncbi:MAG: DMT family transporter [Erysipelotrichaceae bacterium]|nr:DMT family transporter [Erysipelotrichaceae bacterium]
MIKKGIFLTVLSALLYGITPIVTFFSFQLGNNPFTLTFFRSFFVLPVLGLAMIIKKIDFKLSITEFKNILLAGLIGTVLTHLTLSGSYNYIGVGSATTIHYLYPVMVMLFSKFFYKDNISKKQLVVLGLSVFGISFFLDFNDVTKIKGILMAVTSSITFGFYVVHIDKSGLSKMNGIKLSFYLSLVLITSFLIVNIFINQLILNQPIESYILMFVVAMLASFLAVVCLKEGIRLIGSGMASILSMIEPISTLIFGKIFFNEAISINKIIGSLIIIVAILIMAYRPKSKKT